MKVGPLHHTAVVVPSLEDALSFYKDILGMRAGEPALLPEQGVRAVFLESGGARIELIEPVDGESGVARFLAERGRPALHHVCYEVADIDAAIAELGGSGVELIDAVPRKGLEGRVAFLHPRASGGVLIELLQPSHRSA